LLRLYSYIFLTSRLSYKFSVFLIVLLGLLLAILDSFSVFLLVPLVSLTQSSSSLVDLSSIPILSVFYGNVSFPSLIILFLSLVCINALLRALLLYSSLGIAAKLGNQFTKVVFASLIYRNPLRDDSLSSTYAINSVYSNVGSVVQAFSTSLALSASFFTSLLVYASVITVGGYPIVIVSLFIISGYLLIFLSVKNPLKRLSSIEDNSKASLLSTVQDAFVNHETIAVSSLQNPYSSMILDADRSLRTSQSRIIFLTQVPRYTIESLVSLSFLALFLSSRLISSSDILAPSFFPQVIAILYGFQRLLPSFQSLYSSISFLSSLKAPIDNILNIIMLSPYGADRNIAPLAAYHSHNTSVAYPLVRLSNISFAYPSCDLILDSVNLDISIGQTVAITGSSGSGKSTLLSIIMGFMSPTSGHILHSGRIVPLYPASERLQLLSSFSLVSQSNLLWNSTIIDNITGFAPQHTIDPLFLSAILDAVCLSGFIDALPFGLNTSVGEHGARLSGGQRQRILIARALYSQPSLLILDEPTSALDSELESAVISSIRDWSPSMSILLITHKSAPVDLADRVYRLQNRQLCLTL